MNDNLNRQKSASLGATWDGEGVHFALFSENATSVQLCLFDEQERETRLPMIQGENYIWYLDVADLQPGQKYGFRVDEPYHPEQGHRFNPAKLLIDPYSKAIAGDVVYGQELFNYSLASPQPTPSLLYLGLDNRALMPKSVVVDDSFAWEGDRC